ncbi:SMP-30/gluconolactonase/LRE family protein [Tenacibaculum haliotis]|uniref:SMP-30/gluconolactonase/LRE family protein n=1 Tax=Tenacibaculum haliotis TaxID=1888914 RepID=UPI0021AFF215|nr:SMP-30/gluconolactonase/LRE family protein [Tenacibaculum haliotis]MCT4699497.1 SMP-30/gluconolactonase/LRE family protein [Tenacibaculum haliotis]
MSRIKVTTKRLFYYFTCMIFLFFSCKKENYYVAFDFTEEHLFTKGIEGPAVDSKGSLYAVNFDKEGTIGRVDEKGNSISYITLPKNSIGNGIRFDKEDNMYIADYVNHNVLIVKKNSIVPNIYAHNKEMNQPNDLTISPSGIIYLSDPNWSDNTGNLWMVINEKMVLLEQNMGTTNGIEVNPSGTKLYVNESHQKKIWVYDINKDGTIKNKKLFKNFIDFGLDGMRCDSLGNLYVCRYGKGTVVILSPKAVLLEEISLKGKKPTNITFGGLEKKQCFITMSDRGCFESFYTQISGKSF